MVKSDQAWCVRFGSARIKHCDTTPDRAGFVSPEAGEEDAFEENGEPAVTWYLPIAEVFPNDARQALSGLASRSYFAPLLHGTSTHLAGLYDSQAHLEAPGARSFAMLLQLSESDLTTTTPPSPE